MQQCEHGVVAGTCNFCLAETLEYQQKVLEVLRVEAAESERKRESKRES